ncbi:MAG: hypothetical protein ACI87A_003207 [Planctomycetota bacterium]|jgi:hypothetical protein
MVATQLGSPSGGDVRAERFVPLALIVFVLVGVSWIFHRAWFDSNIEFLPPGNSPWWVHAEIPIEFQEDDPTPAVEFTSALEVTAETGPVWMGIRTLGTPELRLGTQKVPVSSAESWKLPTRVDLRPYIGSVAGSELAEFQVTVLNSSGPPALSIHFDETVVKQTPWIARLQLEGELPSLARDTSVRFSGESQGPWAWAFLIVMVTWLAASSKKPNGPHAKSPPLSPKVGRWALILLFTMTVIVFLADLQNAMLIASMQGYDAPGHFEYIEHVATGNWFPTASDGWQMYHPPLYYILVSLLGDEGGLNSASTWLSPGQVLNCFAHAALLPLAFGFFQLLYPNKSKLWALLAAASVAVVPAGMQLAPMVTNEPFAGTLIASVLLAVGLTSNHSPRVWHGLLIGLGLGAAMLSKYTGVLAFGAALTTWFVMGIRAPRAERLEHLKRIVVMASITIAISGWLYLRNNQLFGDFFIGNWDEASGYAYEQGPGYRDLASTFRFGPCLTEAGLSTSSYRSIPEGYYSSIWADPLGFFLGNERFPSAQTWMLWLGLIPTALAIAGLARSWKHSGRTESGAHFGLVLFTALFGLALFTFSLELPFYSTNKGFFAWSLFPVLAAWSTGSLARMWSARRLAALPWVIVTATWMIGAWLLFEVAGPGIAL